MIKRLIDLGVEFDRSEDGSYQYGREGAHRRSRILHICGDATGKHLINTVKKRILDKQIVVEGETVFKLIIRDGRCIGVWSLDERGEMSATYAASVVLATGGLSGLYPFNSNAATVTGDGMALAYEAGAVLTDMEFIQFHPTLLLRGRESVGLVTEAIRGEGGILVDEYGNRLMQGVHPLGDLAPRDIVSRELYRARQQGKKTYLDIRRIPRFSERFPTVTELCRKNGIPWENGFLQVAPGAHFSMGGIEVDASARTSIPGLFAIGETAHTGVHGANRLASNSLLEGMVTAEQVAQTILYEPKQRLYPPVSWLGVKVLKYAPQLEQIRTILDTCVGIERNEQQLVKAINWFESYLDQQVYTKTPHLEEVQIKNQLLVAWLVAKSSLERTESRGSHYRSDYPYQVEEWRQKRIKRRKWSHEPFEITTHA